MFSGLRADIHNLDKLEHRITHSRGDCAKAKKEEHLEKNEPLIFDLRGFLYIIHIVHKARYGTILGPSEARLYNLPPTIP